MKPLHTSCEAKSHILLDSIDFDRRGFTMAITTIYTQLLSNPNPILFSFLACHIRQITTHTILLPQNILLSLNKQNLKQNLSQPQNTHKAFPLLHHKQHILSTCPRKFSFL